MEISELFKLKKTVSVIYPSQGKSVLIMDKSTVFIPVIFSVSVLLLGIEIVMASSSASAQIAEQSDLNETMSLDSLGLKGRDLTSEELSNLNYDEALGYRVTDVLDSHPAKNAVPALEINDTILEVDNQLVNNTASLESYVRSKKINDSLDFTVVRDQKIMRIGISPPYSLPSSNTSIVSYNNDIMTPYYDPFKEYYTDPANGLILEYPPNSFTLSTQSEYGTYENLSNINFIPTNGTDLNQNKFQFNVNISQKSWPITLWDVAFHAASLQETLTLTHVDYQKLGTNMTNDIGGRFTFMIMYSYHDPFENVTNGTLFYSESNDKIVSVTYENTGNKFLEWLPLIKDIVHSISVLDYKPVVWGDHGIYFEVPSTWQLQSKKSDFISLNVSDYSQLTIKYSESNSTFNGQCKRIVHDDTILDQDHSKKIKCDFMSESEPLTVTFEGLENELIKYSRFIDNISDNSSSLLMNTDHETALSVNFSKGTIPYPFHISYPPSWNFSEFLSGYVGKTVEFRPNATKSNVSLAISYWNENDYPLAKAAYSEGIYQGEDANTYIVGDFSNSDFTGKEALYFTDVNPGTGMRTLVSTSYLKGNNEESDSVLVWSYSGPVDEYFEYWPNAKKMIESLRLLKPVEPLEPHGIRVGESPNGIFYDENDDIIFVANSGSRSISMINATDFQGLKFGNHDDIKLEDVHSNPFDLAYDSDSRSLYVVHNTVGTSAECVGALSKIQLNRSSEHILFDNLTISVPIDESRDFCPVDVVVDKNSVAFVGDPSNNKLYIVYPNKPISNISLGETSGRSGIGLVLDENAQRLYIANPNYFEGIQFVDTEDYQLKSIRFKLVNNQSCPIDVGMDRELNRLYVVDKNNSCDQNDIRNGILLIVDPLSGEVAKRVLLGQSPNNVVIDSKTHKVYVTNSGSDSLTVVDPLTYRTFDAKVGISPSGVTNNPDTGMVYTTSSGSNSVSMLNARTNKIEHLITFKVEPPGSGLIKCQGKYMMLDMLIPVSDNAMCEAEPTKLTPFIFQTWSPETLNNLGNVNHELENESNKSMVVRLIESFNTNAELPVLTSGTFTANFIESNSLFTQEQLTGLYALAIGLFSSWFVPNLAHWIYSGRKSKIQNETFSRYLKDLQAPAKDVTTIRESILRSLSEGRLSESQYTTLDEKLHLSANRESSGPGH